MRTLLIVNTGNDIDIIEESLLHNEKFFDNIIVADRQSYDGTVEVVKKLMETHPKISFIDTNYEPEYQWTWLVTALQTHKNNYDYIVFLDADEFIRAKDLSEFDTIPDNSVGMLKWQCYIPEKDVFKDFKKNITHRRTKEKEDWHKLVYPTRNNVIPSNGNHYCKFLDGNHVPMVELNIKLAHFTVRSKWQINRKIKFWKDVMAGKDKTFCSHIRNMEEITTDEQLRQSAIDYGDYFLEGQEVIYDPVE